MLGVAFLFGHILAIEETDFNNTKLFSIENIHYLHQKILKKLPPIVSHKHSGSLKTASLVML